VAPGTHEVIVRYEPASLRAGVVISVLSACALLLIVAPWPRSALPAVQTLERTTTAVLGRGSWLVRQVKAPWERMLGWISTRRGLPWTVNGVTYRIDARCRRRLAHDYEAPVAAFLRSSVKPGAVCVDVGANVGVYVLQFAHWSSPSGRVVAFEPNPAACAMLRRHLQWNGIESRVDTVPVAVGAAAGPGTLYAAGHDGMSRLETPNPAIASRTHPLPVPMVTLDEYGRTAGLQPDWLFIDIEGEEIAALAGASAMIRARGAALGIVVDMHPNSWPAGVTRADVERLLRDLRRRVVPITGQSDPLAEYGVVSLEAIEA
jgi:FkbM family methyltransferase